MITTKMAVTYFTYVLASIVEQSIAFSVSCGHSILLCFWICRTPVATHVGIRIIVLTIPITKPIYLLEGWQHFELHPIRKIYYNNLSVCMNVTPGICLKYCILNRLQKSGLAVTPKCIMTFINISRQLNKDIYITSINGSSSAIRTHITAMCHLTVNTPKLRVDSFRNSLITLRD